MACSLDAHPLIKEIDSMLRQEPAIPYGAIREFLTMQEFAAPEDFKFSRHRKGCLKLTPRGHAAKEQADMSDAPVPAIDDIIDEGLKIFHWRLKNDPEKIKTNELVSVLVQAMRTKEGRGRDTDIKKRLAQITDAYESEESG